MKVRKESLEELNIMKTDNETYLYEFLKNMHQIQNVIKETWNLADLALQNKDYELRRKCLNEIANYTALLNKSQDFLPAACSMKLFDNEFAKYKY
jgi:hypothetical protein